MMAANALNDDDTNYLRAVYLCYRVAPESVRTYFDKQHPPSQLVNELAAERSNLQSIKGRILKQYQWDQLYPSTGRSLPTSTDFDITLLICLLRNMKPTIPPPPFGFDNLPYSSHTTDGAHLARIKCYRNNLAHSTDGKLSNTDFGNLWNDLEVAIRCLGGNSFVKEVNDVKSRSLDNTLTEILRHLVEYDKQYNELSNAITELKDVIDEDNKQRTADVTRSITELEDKLENKSNEMSNLCSQMQQQVTRIDKHSSEIRELQKAIAAMEMESIPNNRRELIKMHLEKWKEHDVMFIQTRAADKVYEMIKENCCLTVTGNSGMGKTMTVRHVALQMVEEGHTVVPISHPEEIVMLFSAQKKTLFVVDDLCGKYTLNHSYFDRFKLNLEDINLLLEKQYCKVIATCRLQVFRDVKFKTLPIFNVFACNFNSKDMTLTPEETEIFAIQYFGSNSNAGMTLSADYDCFPFLCSVYHNTNDGDFDQFCKNPFQLFGEEIDNLFLEGEEGKYKYCILVLCLIYNNSLTEGCLTGKHGTTTRQIIAEVFEDCELNANTPPKCLQKALQTIVGTFVSKEDNCYKMIHDKLFDFVAFYIGKTMKNILIEHADSEFIQERFTWGISEDTIDFTISIPDDLVDTYIHRIIRDWENKRVVEFFSNRNLKSSAFTDKLVYHLKKMHKYRQLQLVNIQNDCKFRDTPLIQSCRTGNIKLAQWILEHDVSVNQCRTDGITPLHMACQEGSVHIVKVLLQHGANVNKRKLEAGTQVNTTCDLGHTGVVIELLTNDNIDIDSCDNEGRTSMYLACQAGHVLIVKALIQHQADINKCRINGWSPLHIACFNRHPDVVVEILKSNQSIINIRDHEECTPLFVACIKGHNEIVHDLLRHGAYINECLHNDWSLLHTACFHGHANVVTELLGNHDLSINLGDNRGRTPLYLACQEGYVRIVRNLIGHGVDVNKCGKDGCSPLHAAYYSGHKDVVTELLKNDNVEIDLCDNEGRSALYLACQNGYVEIVRFILQKRPDLCKCDEKGQSPLHTACYNNYHAIVIELLKIDKLNINLCDDMGYSSLHRACQNGNVRIIQDLLQHGANPNMCARHGRSPLHTSCVNKYKDVVTELLKNDNVKIDICDNTGHSPLFLACHNGCEHIVRSLLQHGADINKCDKDGWSPLHTACYNEREDVVTELLNNENVKIDLCDNEGRSPLSLACRQGYIKLVRNILLHGADINKCDKDGWSPLHTACYNKREVEMNELLKNKNIEIDICSNHGSSPLYVACHEENVKTVRTLLKHGADMNKTNKYGWSPLHISCYNECEDVVTELLKNDNVQVDLCDNEGRCPLFLVCQEGNVQIVRQLIQHGADINKFDKDGWSPLHTACYYKYEDVVTELLKNENVKIDLCNNMGRSPLYLACQKGNVHLVRKLLQHGTDINKTDKNGCSPLHTACYHKYEDVVTELLKNENVKIDLCDNEGRSPLSLACRQGYIKLVKNILQRGADLNKCNKDGWSPLHTACYNECTDVVTELLKNDNVKIDLCNNMGRSPLYLACQKGNVQIVGELVQHGTDINKCDKDGWSPLHTACYNKYEHVVTEFFKNENVKIDLCDNKGRSLLYVACQKGSAQIVRDLLQYGADINKCRKNGWSPLHKACFDKCEDIVTELLKNDNVKINLLDNDGRSPFYLACRQGCVKTVDALIQHGADISKCSNHGNSPLQTACTYNHIDVVSELLNHDVTIDSYDKDGYTALYSACEEGHTEVVKLLLDWGMNVNICSNTGESPLLISCVLGNIEIVDMLLQKDADVNLCIHRKDVYMEEIRKYQNIHLDNEKSILTEIKGYGSWKSKEYTDYGDWIVNKIAGASALQLACYMGHENIVNLLLEKIPNINMTTDDGTTALFLACEIGHEYLATLLLTGGADAHICREDGKTPFHVALDNGHGLLAAMLLRWTNGVEVIYHR